MKRWLIRGVAGLGLVVAWWLGPHLLRHLALFQVRRVEVIGAVYLSPAEVARAMALRPKANLFDDLGPWRERVLAMPGVRQVAIGRRIPGALVVTVTEFEPVALTMADGRLAPVDRRGRVLPFDPTRAPTDLPLVPADPQVTSLIDALRETDPDLFRAVVSAKRERSTIIVETVTQRLLFRAGAEPKDIQALAAVRAEAKRLGLGASEFDARFEGRVVVRGRG